MLLPLILSCGWLAGWLAGRANSLQRALLQLQNSQEDCVDRTLVSNLLVTYLSLCRAGGLGAGARSPREVLELISRILAFSDQQKREVGLASSSSSSGSSSVGGRRGEGNGYLSSWIGSINPFSSFSGHSGSGDGGAHGGDSDSDDLTTIQLEV